MEKRHSSAALQNLAMDPTAIYRLRFGVRRCSAAFDDLHEPTDLLRRACYSFGTFAAIGGRALCQSVLCS